jgi:hypothetical protein
MAFWEKDSDVRRAVKKMRAKRLNWTVANMPPPSATGIASVHLTSEDSDGFSYRLIKTPDQIQLQISSVISAYVNRMPHNNSWKIDPKDFAALDSFIEDILPPGFISTYDIEKRERDEAAAKQVSEEEQQRREAEARKQRFWNS